MALVHLPCSARAEYAGEPYPPDPDRWGNKRHGPFTCPACGDRGYFESARHGGKRPIGLEWAFPDTVSWTVPLPDGAE